MISDRYVWLVWSSAFLVPWLIIYSVFPQQRRIMGLAALFTAPLGLTEPLFVPAYWSPPSLFDLARTTGFDIESLIFSFGIGGVAVVFYNLFISRELVTMAVRERHTHRHKLHGLALITPFVSFLILYALPWNPIYAAIAALFTGALATAFCRPDLLGNLLGGALLFTIYYSVFLAGIEWTAPGYIERVWNLGALSGVRISAIPIEELLFAAAFGAYWSGVYEHLTWRTFTPQTL